MHKTTLTHLKFTALVCACCLSLSAQADSYLAEPMLVTASRIAENIEDTLANASIIEREEIERSQAPDLLELLRLQSGIDIVRSGPSGAQTSLFMRGTNSNHTLILIDGVRVNSTNTGALAWENLPLAQIERIEIVRGPRTSFYGADAIGGVIQIFTRQTEQTSIRLGIGSYSQQEISASSGYRSERSTFSVTAGWRDSNGFSAQNENGFGFDPDDDGFNTWNISLRGSLDTTASSQLSYSLLYTDNENEFDQGQSWSQQSVFGLNWDYCTTCNYKQKISLGYTQDKLDTITAYGGSNLLSDHSSIGWQLNREMEQASWVFGVDLDSESGRSKENYKESRNNLAAYSGLTLEAGKSDVQLALRYDDNSVYGNELTGNAALGVYLGSNLKLIASYGTAFRAPTMNELYSSGFFGLFAGNPDLEAESSDSAELSVRWQIASTQNLSLSAYKTKIDKLIAFSGEDFQAVNINQAEINGVEAEYQLSTSNWQLRANATFQDTEDKSTGNSLLRRPDEKYSLTLDRRWANGTWLGGEVFYSGKREDFGATLKSYTLVNLRAGFPLNNGFRIEGRVENLLDEYYQPAFGFNAADRSYYLSVLWQR